MEIEKAIEELKSFSNGNKYDTEYTDLEVFNLAIMALEKQIAKKPEKVPQFKGLICAYCPICETGIDEGNSFCHQCGQKLDWSEVGGRR